LDAIVASDIEEACLCADNVRKTTLAQEKVQDVQLLTRRSNM